MPHVRSLPSLTLLGMLALGGWSSIVTATNGDEKPPKAVMKAAKLSYPGAKVVGVSREKDEEGETVYEVELMVKGKSVNLLIDEEGEIEETEKEISKSDLPRAVIKALAKAYPQAKLEKIEEVTDDEDKVLYEIVVKSPENEAVEVVVAPNGKILETVEADDEDEDDDKPKAKKKSMEDDEDDKPKAKKQSMEEDEDKDEDDKPKAKKKSAEADKNEEKPKRSSIPDHPVSLSFKRS